MRILSWFTIILFAVSCNSKKNQTASPAPSLDETFGKYIVEHTGHNISVADKIVFRFSGTVIKPGQEGSDVDKNLYSIKPNVKGRAYWKDLSTLIFEPSDMLDYETRYDFTVNLSTLFDDVPKETKNATISFSTRKMELRVNYYQIKYPPNDGDLMNITGTVRSSDYIPNEAIEKMLKASQKGSKIEVLWNHHSSTSHGFEITGIQRQKDESSVSINWDGSKWDSFFNENKKTVIAPKGAFKIITAEAAKGENRNIIIDFTSQLDKSQNLDGLISIKNYKGKYKYDIIGSRVTVYPQNKVTSPFELVVAKSIKNKDNSKLKSDYSKNLSFDPIKPALKLAGKGVIVPFNDEIIFPFEAINLKGAKVEIFKIFDDNVLQFLQYNRLNTTHSLHPVGRVVHQENIELRDLNPEQNDANYVRYALDLTKLITPDPGSIYQVRIGFELSDAINLECKDEKKEETQVLSQRDGFTSIMTNNNNYDGYRWEHRNDPCKPAFYNSSKYITRNVLASNIGIIAKRDRNNTINIALTDLKTVNPINGASVTFYDFQQQEISTANSEGNGMLFISMDRTASFAIVKNGNEFGYINLQDKHSNSLSEFEVSGKSKKKGIDGFIYGERGVWRPGDTLFLNFILEDKLNKLPTEHPITITIKDSRGKQKYTKTSTSHLDHVYNFPVPTSDSDPTGNWTAIVQVGGSIYQKTLKVETVKPNRLKIKYDLDDDQPLALYNDQKINLTSTWLHGAPADGLKARVDLQIRPVRTTFKKYTGYRFDDPARKIEPQPATIFDGNLDADGNTSFKIDNKKNWLAPGKLRANFTTKVFEKGGNFSEDNFSTTADLYGSYVGIKIPTTRWGSKFIKENTPTDIPLIVVDTDGKPIANRNLSIGIYEANWNWWYDRGYSDKFNYNSAKHTGALTKDKVTTDAKGEAKYNIRFDDYGNYMIRICDDITGHCTGDMFYTGYSWSSQGSQDGPQQLIFKTDKKSYSVGENIEVKIPSNQGSKIFMSIENGEKVLQAFWVDGKKDETVIEIPTDISMNSNIYLHAHLVQPHNNGENDLPMRMFGVVPVSVIDPGSQINPEITMPESIRPNEKYTIKIEEKDGKPMTYTVAVVDEGLLDLTRFKTPDTWNHFYAKQALGVKTWDIYDMVLDGYGGALDRYISIGGDGASGKGKGKKANRFVPVVTHLGPFTLSKGGQKTHEITMPNYVGSVRTMVVARHGVAYGSQEETTPVKKPLMVLATLPRVLGPSESLTLPANVFAMEDNIKNVKVSVESSDNVSITGPKNQALTFDKVGDKLAYFDMNVGEATGQANVKVRVQGHGEGAFEEVNIDIRNPNPYTSKVYEASIEPGESWSMDYELFGTPGSNEGILEMSNIPPMNFGRRLKYLIRYPYGCIEQTTSSVFPQLYLETVTDLDDRKKHKIENNIRRGIERLSLFQTSSGGFGYWPGDNSVNEWGTNYAGHFMVEAKEKGYYVADHMLKGFVKYQDARASNTNLSESSDSYSWQSKTQAYRLYTLAKAGSPNLGAMNRLRNKKLNAATAHMLAAAYAIVGKKDIAKALVANVNLEVKPYVETGYTYGSGLRDLAMMAEAQQVVGNSAEAAQLIKQISRQMSSQSWYSTQTTAYALLSIGKFLSSYEKDDLKYEYAINGGQPDSGVSTKPTVQKVVEVEGSATKNVNVTNTSTSIMYVRYVLSGQLPPGTKEEKYNKHISLSVNYTDRDGKKIDPKSIKQGTDFTVDVVVKNLGSRAKKIDEIALSQIFPSGWEIQNDRMSSMSDTNGNSRYDYRDIRDDRVYTFFDIQNRTPTMKFSVNLTAAYAGRFYLSPVYVEAMYDNEIQAKTEGMWVEVVK